MNSFNAAYAKIIESLDGNTSAGAFGSPAVVHSQFSSDSIYAPGDARIPSFLGAKKKKGKQGKLKITMQRRKLFAQ